MILYGGSEMKQGGATVRANRFNVFFAAVIAICALLGLIGNLTPVWIAVFGVIIALCILFIVCACRIKIYCGEDGFIYFGALGQRFDAEYTEIESLAVTPFTVKLVMRSGKTLSIPTPCVSGIRMFINIAKINNIVYPSR